MNNNSIHDILEHYWGFKSFKTKQEAIINDVLNQKDTLALLPTGGGKSICYQIPALVKKGICIVISPLIALMNDQTNQLKKKNIKAIHLSSGLTQNELDIALDNCIYGEIKLLYLSPERLKSDLVRERIKKMNVNLIAVDEAHCISQWGYDFRPSYLNIAELREIQPNTPILALTATATKKVAKDIQEKLLFKKNNTIRTSFKRDNLAYMVLEESDKSTRVQKILQKIKGSAIVYVRSRKKAYEFSKELMELKIKSSYYHAGLSVDDRNNHQEKWMTNKVRVMVATNAFGMGIDKPDVRLVIHLQQPDTTEAYFQEAGRAGRDGKKAYAISLFQKSDLENAINKFNENYPTFKELRKIYQHLANFFQIAIGDGFEKTYNLKFEQFCSRYNLNPHKCLKAFRLLEKDNLIKYNSYIGTSSTIQIIATPKSVINYTSANSKKIDLLKLILRLYPGIFDECIEIKERNLAIQMLKDSSYINKMLKQLDQENIISYKQRDNTSKITFCSARYNSKHLRISELYFNKNKSHLKKKLQHMNDYLLNKSFCRSRILLDYFGEIQSEDCNICDLCISKNSDTNLFKKQIRLKLLESVKKNPIDIHNFVTSYSKIQENIILNEINELISDKLLIKIGKTLKTND